MSHMKNSVGNSLVLLPTVVFFYRFELGNSVSHVQTRNYFYFYLWYVVAIDDFEEVSTRSLSFDGSFSPDF